MLSANVLAQTGFEYLIPQGSPWWVIILFLVASTLTFVIRQSMNNRTITLNNQFNLQIEKVKKDAQKERDEFKLKLQGLEHNRAQDAASASAIQSLSTTLGQAITGLQDTIRTFAEERRESTQAIKENTDVYRKANETALQQAQKLDKLLEKMDPLTNAIPEAVSLIVRSFNQTERSIVDAVDRSMEIGIVIIDRDNRITASNPQATKLLKTDRLPERIPHFVRMYTFPGRDVIPRTDWICNRVLSEKRSSYAIAGVTGGNREIIWLWIIAEPHGEDAVRLALLDATDAVRALKHIDEETKRITDELPAPSN